MTMRPIDVIVPVHGAAAAHAALRGQRARGRAAGARSSSSSSTTRARTPSSSRYLRELAAHRAGDAGRAARARGLRRRGQPRHSRCIATATSVILHCDADGRQRLARPARLARAARARHRRRRAVHQQRRRRRLSAAATPPIRCPTRQAVASLDALFARANPRQSVALPVVDGPVPLPPPRVPAAASARSTARRSAATTASRSTSACARAARASATLLAGDVFVGHEGHASFGAGGRGARRAQRRRRWPSLYPRYAAQRAATARRSRPGARSPAASTCCGSRMAAAAGRVRRPSAGAAASAGYMNDLAALTRGALRGAVPRAGGRRHGQALLAARRREFARTSRCPASCRCSPTRCARSASTRLHFHHVHLQPRAILDLPAAVGAARTTARCTTTTRSARSITSSPRTAATAASPTPPAAPRASRSGPRQWDLDITTWRGAFEPFLRGAERVIAPSQDVATRMQPLLSRRSRSTSGRIRRPTPPPPPRMARVVVLGNLSPEKGLHVVAACARDAQRARRCR